MEERPLLGKTKDHTNDWSVLDCCSSFFKNTWFRQTFDIYKVCEEGDYTSLVKYIKYYLDEEGNLLPENKRRVRDIVNKPDGIGRSPLYCTAGDSAPGHLACAQLLLRLGANPKYYLPLNSRHTITSFAFHRSSPEMVALLISYGAEDDFSKAIRGFSGDENTECFIKEVSRCIKNIPNYTQPYEAYTTGHLNFNLFIKKNM